MSKSCLESIHIYAYDRTFKSWKDKPITQGVYLHGKLEERNRYDIVSCSSIPKEKGIYKAIVHFADGGVEFDAKFFYWQSEINPIKNRGLIVGASDKKYLKDAQKKYNNDEDFL